MQGRLGTDTDGWVSTCFDMDLLGCDPAKSLVMAGGPDGNSIGMHQVCMNFVLKMGTVLQGTEMNGAEMLHVIPGCAYED